ncbi:hypothetical protein J6590_010230 [Homalodisca vitripennis]|nr:hypothetical protein J6590_010230 [Homalodisca vitripennis]
MAKRTEFIVLTTSCVSNRSSGVSADTCGRSSFRSISGSYLHARTPTTRSAKLPILAGPKPGS